MPFGDHDTGDDPTTSHSGGRASEGGRRGDGPSTEHAPEPRERENLPEIDKNHRRENTDPISPEARAKAYPKPEPEKSETTDPKEFLSLGKDVLLGTPPQKAKAIGKAVYEASKPSIISKQSSMGNTDAEVASFWFDFEQEYEAALFASALDKTKDEVEAAGVLETKNGVQVPIRRNDLCTPPKLPQLKAVEPSPPARELWQKVDTILEGDTHAELLRTLRDEAAANKGRASVREAFGNSTSRRELRNR